MSHEIIEGSIVFFCDNCPKELDTDTNNFREAIEILLDNDWVYDKVGGTYYHTCKNCRN